MARSKSISKTTLPRSNSSASAETGVILNPSAQRRRDIAAVDGRHVGGGLQRQRLRQKGLRDVLGGDLALQQVAAHVVLLGDAARLRPFGDERIIEQAGTDAV